MQPKVGWSAPIPLLGETELVDVIVHRQGKILNIENRNHALKLIHIDHSNLDAEAQTAVKSLSKAAKSH
jgi:hypothetical protein